MTRPGFESRSYHCPSMYSNYSAMRADSGLNIHRATKFGILTLYGEGNFWCCIRIRVCISMHHPIGTSACSQIRTSVPIPHLLHQHTALDSRTVSANEHISDAPKRTPILIQCHWWSTVSPESHVLTVNNE